MIYTMTGDSIEMLPVHHAAEWYDWRPTVSVLATNDALTLSAAHRLIQSLSEQTQSRSELAECRDVLAALKRMVEEG